MCVYLNPPPVNHQNDLVVSAGVKLYIRKKLDIYESRLLFERAKFVKHVIVSADIALESKWNPWICQELK